MTPNPILAALKRGETIVSMWSETGSADLAEAAVHRGWSTILVDNEHGVASLDDAVAIHRAVRSAGGEVILRVPSADPTQLKLVLDRGFRAIMVPMVNSKEAAEALAHACYYPPIGGRGYAAPIVRASGYGANRGYRAGAHDDLLLIAQVEHIDAVKNIADIAATPGIDALFIGPNDLAGSVGRLEELDHQEVLDLCHEAEQAILKSGKFLGSIVRPNRTAADLHKLGCRIIAGPSDIGIFLAGIDAAHEEFAIG